MKLGIIGCGNMGGGMVARLRERGQDLLCFDPDPVILARMQDLGASPANSAAALAQSCDTILLSLPKAAVVRAVMAEILPHLSQGSLILDTSTSEPATSQAMAAEAAKRGALFIDGPVSGGPSAARAGTMTMLLGGEAQGISRLRPLLAHLTAKTVVVGGPGAGHAAKIANNMLCAANLVLVAEALRLGAAAGVAPEALLEGINAGSGRSGVSEVNFPRWILSGAFNSGFTMGLMRKDVGLAMSLAAETGLDLPGFAPIAALWEASAETLPDSADFNAIAKVTP